MALIDTPNGPVEIHDSMVVAAARNAELQADLVAAYFEAAGISSEDASRLPAGFLLELGGIIQLALWQVQGLLRFLGPTVPSMAGATSDLVARVKDNPEQFSSIDNAPLSRQLLRVWLNQFSWDAQSILQAQMVIGEADEDALIEAMARLIWVHRHDGHRENSND